MPSEQIRDQQEVFEEAKNALTNELDPEMLLWDFSKMMEELKKAIREKASNPSDNYRAVRDFSRHYLKIKGEGFRQVQGWLRGELMSADHICNVLQTLRNLPDAPQKVFQEKKRSVAVKKTGGGKNSNVKKMVLAHTRATITSLARLCQEVGIDPKDAYDGDRMQIQEAVKNIFNCLGMKAHFPTEESWATPLTQEELSSIGLKTRRK